MNFTTPQRKYAIEVFEPGVSESSVGTRKILFFDSEADAEKYAASLVKLHDSDGRAYFQRLGVVDVSFNKHPEDCECGACTGEDSAIEAMERGIVRCETNFEGGNI